MDTKAKTVIHNMIKRLWNEEVAAMVISGAAILLLLLGWLSDLFWTGLLK